MNAFESEAAAQDASRATGESDAASPSVGSEGVALGDGSHSDACEAPAPLNDVAKNAALDDGVAAEDIAVGGVAAPDAAPTPEEQFLLQVLSDDDLAELRARQAAEAAAEEEEEELSPEEREEKAEHDALAAAFAMVRSRSNAGKLTTPGTWAAEGLVPEQLLPVDFCDIAFDTIIAAQAESAERAKAAAEAQAAAAAAPKDVAEGAAPDAQAASEASEFAQEASDAAAEAEPCAETSAEGGSDAAPAELAAVPEWQLDDIKVLEGKQTYLYSSDYMTDTYAHWAFLAEEGDDALTLVDNARTESRLYPRPMLATSLSNKPYCWDNDKIAAAWQAVQESGAYPDIQTCSASNGDRYFYSTDYLSTAQAKALAEWYSVERCRNV